MVNCLIEIFNDHAVFIRSLGSEAEVCIPGAIDGRELIAVKEGAFSDCGHLTGAYMPAGIAGIEDKTFFKCPKLYRIYCPAGITYIGESAFEWDYSLKSIEFYSSDDSKDGKPNTSCHSDIIESSSRTCITASGVIESSSNTSINASDINESSSNTLCNASENVKSDDITASGAESSKNAYLNAAGNDGHNIPEARRDESGPVHLVGHSLPNADSDTASFENRRHSMRPLRISDTFYSIGPRAFSFCYMLSHFVVPAAVRHIYDMAFFSCHSLTHIKLPNHLLTIGRQAFSHCSMLGEVEIPAGVTFIDDSAFSYCGKSLCLVVHPGSYAEEYAKKRNIPYKLIAA